MIQDMKTLKLTDAEARLLMNALESANVEAPRLKRRLQALITPPSKLTWDEAFERGRALVENSDPTESPDYVTHENRFDPSEVA